MYTVANDNRLRTPYNKEDPLESLIERLNNCADLSTAASELVSETQLVCIAYGMVSDTGKYPEYFWAWRNQYKKAWTSFQTHFMQAQADL